MQWLSRPMVPHSRACLEFLADGKWHPWDDVVSTGARTVPPGRAFRRGESLRNRVDKRPLGKGPRVKGDDSDSIRVGARAMTRSCLQAHVRQGRVEQKGEVRTGGVKQDKLWLRITKQGREALEMEEQKVRW